MEGGLLPSSSPYRIRRRQVRFRPDKLASPCGAQVGVLLCLSIREQDREGVGPMQKEIGRIETKNIF